MENQSHNEGDGESIVDSRLLAGASGRPRFVAPFAVEPLMRGRANQVLPRGFADAADALASSIWTEFIGPALRTKSRDAYLELFTSRLPEFAETMQALKTVFDRALPAERRAEVSESSYREVRTDVRSVAHELAGPDAADDVDFANDTFHRAAGLVPLLVSAEAPEELRDRDGELAASFRGWVNAYHFALLSILGAASERAVPDVIGASFELCRGAALGAYASAREAVELRCDASPADGVDLAALDDEDLALANAD